MNQTKVILVSVFNLCHKYTLRYNVMTGTLSVPPFIGHLSVLPFKCGLIRFLVGYDIGNVSDRIGILSVPSASSTTNYNIDSSLRMYTTYSEFWRHEDKSIQIIVIYNCSTIRTVHNYFQNNTTAREQCALCNFVPSA